MQACLLLPIYCEWFLSVNRVIELRNADVIAPIEVLGELLNIGIRLPQQVCNQQSLAYLKRKLSLFTVLLTKANAVMFSKVIKSALMSVCKSD